MCPHDCTGPVVWIANLHISLAFPSAMILESVRAFYNGFYNNLVTNLPKIENGLAFPMAGVGLGTELHQSLLNSPDTSIKKTAAIDL
jgi:L-alanine-DL-glutamate epimerase-like enolase superfamily enzyme